MQHFYRGDFANFIDITRSSEGYACVMIVNNITIMSSDKSQTNLQSVRMLYRALWSLPLTDYYSDDQIKKNVTGGTRSTYNGEQSAYGRLGGETYGNEPTCKTSS